MRTENWVEQVCANALSWENTPYQPHGNVRGVGVDCGHFIREVYEPVCGPFPPMPRDYSADWAMHTESEKYLDFIMPFVKPTTSIAPGGFSLFHIGLAYSHSAIFLANGNYIHAWGRLRAGRVMQSDKRIMEYMGRTSGHPIKHFEPK